MEQKIRRHLKFGPLMSAKNLPTFVMRECGPMLGTPSDADFQPEYEREIKVLVEEIIDNKRHIRIEEYHEDDRFQIYVDGKLEEKFGFDICSFKQGLLTAGQLIQKVRLFSSDLEEEVEAFLVSKEFKNPRADKKGRFFGGFICTHAEVPNAVKYMLSHDMFC